MANYSLSALKSFIATHQSEPFWIGIDVHKRSYHLALLRVDGRTFTLVVPALPAQLVEQFLRLEISIAGVVYEAGPAGFGLARTLQEEGIPVTVAAPSKVPRSVGSGSKTDRLACLKLAQYVAKGLIRPIAIPTTQEEAHRALLRRRHQLVDSIRRCKQRIKGFLLYHGFKESEAVKNWRFDFPEQIASLALEAEGRLAIDSHLRELNFLQDELSSVTSQLDQINLKPNYPGSDQVPDKRPWRGESRYHNFSYGAFPIGTLQARRRSRQLSWPGTNRQAQWRTNATRAPGSSRANPLAITADLGGLDVASKGYLCSGTLQQTAQQNWNTTESDCSFST